MGLDFFESKKVHGRAGSTAGGRASSLLGAALFRGGAGGSWSAFPRRYTGEVSAGSCYHLHDDDVDWHHGEVRLLATRRQDMPVSQFHAAVAGTLDAMDQPGADRDGALAAVGEDYLALWRHAAASGGASRSRCRKRARSAAEGGRLVMSGTIFGRGSTGIER